MPLAGAPWARDTWGGQAAEGSPAGLAVPASVQRLVPCGRSSPSILACVPKVFVSLNVKRLGQLDRAAKKAGLSRSAYVARLVDRDLEGAGAAPPPEGDGTVPELSARRERPGPP